MENYLRKTIIVLSVLFISVGSYGSKKLSKKNLASIYSEFSFTTVESAFYHSSTDATTAFMKIELNDFTYLKEGTDTSKAMFRIEYSLYEDYNSKTPIDTASIVFSDALHAGEEIEMIVDFDVAASYPGTYLLMIELTDLNKPKHQHLTFYTIDKSKKNSPQNFLVTDANDFPVFGSHVGPGQQFKIRYNNPDTSNLFVRYYDRQFPLAKTPFAQEKEFTYKFDPDSIFSISLVNGLSETLELPFEGIYHIQTDLSLPEGLTLFHFYEGFPEVTTPEQAIAPLRYLTTQKEFDQLKSYSNYKMAVDSFWLERSSQQLQRAKNMIKRYYSRIQDANRFFSSYHEGWKTDMGIIYIIYGPPSEVYRNNDEEEWVYGERGNPMSIRFFFYQVDNPFTLNDFSLQRSSVYKNSWLVAIENWRR